jgi:hypothetical protein
MSDRQRQQRAAMIVGGAAVGGLIIIGLAIALTSGGGDDTNAVETQHTTSSSSSTTSSSSTSTSTSTTTTLVTLPPTAASTSPPTIITIPPPPPTVAPTVPPTSPPTTKPPTTTTKPPNPAEQLALTLDTALNGGQPNAPARVTVAPMGHNKVLDVTWKLDSALPPDQQGVQARSDALVLLETIQSQNPPGNDKFRLRGTLPKPGKDQVILLTINRSAFQAFDFSSYDPDTTDVFTLPFVTSADINTKYVPDPYPPTSTTSTSGGTTTTEASTTTTT